MKITIEATRAATVIEPEGGGVPVRIWRGMAEDGTPVHAFIALLAVPASADQGLAPRDLIEIEPFPAPSPEAPQRPPVSAPGAFVFADDPRAGGAVPPQGVLVFADDPRAGTARKVAAALEPSVRYLAAEAGWQAALDGLATVYLDEAVRHFGPKRAAECLTRMAAGTEAVAESQRTGGVGGAPAQGSA